MKSPEEIGSEDAKDMEGGDEKSPIRTHIEMLDSYIKSGKIEEEQLKELKSFLEELEMDIEGEDEECMDDEGDTETPDKGITKGSKQPSLIIAIGKGKPVEEKK